MTKNKTVAQYKAEIEQLKADNIRLAKSTVSQSKTKFRIETTADSNNFHVSYNSIFDADKIKDEFTSLFVSEVEEVTENKAKTKSTVNKCYVFDAKLKEVLLQRLQEQNS